MRTITKSKIIKAGSMYLEEDINKFCEHKDIKSVQLLNETTALIVYDMTTE